MAMQKVPGAGVAVVAAVVVASVAPGPGGLVRAVRDVPSSEIVRLIEARLPALAEFETTPDAIVARSGDPVKLFEWVRANTTYAAYEGSLRGPAGVLMDRHGNSLDRALLLARLFELAGIDARVVTGTLAQGAETSKPSARRASDAEPPSDESRLAVAVSSSITAAIGSLPAPAALTESTHYWVQYRDGQRWVDADPALSEIGASYPHTDEQPASRFDGPPADVTGADWAAHAVTMRLVVERWQDGRLVEDLLALIPFEPTGGPLVSKTVSFLPVHAKTRKPMARAFASGAELHRALLGETAWGVVVQDSGPSWRIGRMFDETGTIGGVPGTAGAARMGEATASAASGLLSMGMDEGPAEPPVLTALMADYEIALPGRASRVVRRVIFDSIGPDRRRDGRELPKPIWTEQQRIERGASLAAFDDTLVAFSALPEQAYVDRYARRIVDAKDALLALETGKADEVTLERAHDAVSIRTLELYAAVRSSEMASGLVVTEPQIYRRVTRPMPDPASRDLGIEVRADLVWNRIGSHTNPSVLRDVVTQGVLDTLQESVIVLRGDPARPAQTTAALFDEAARQRIDAMAVRESNDERLAGFPAPTRALMQNDLDAGFILVAPSRPVLVDGRQRAAWWRVDPGSGHVVGVLDSGLLGDDTEYAITHEVNGVRIVKFTKPPPSPATRAYMRDLQARKPGISKDALRDIARLVEAYVKANGRLPL